MVMVHNMAEARSTPSYPTMASPRYGGCVGAFLYFFTPANRFSSTKRLSGNKPDKAFRRSRSFRGDQGLVGKTRMMYQSGANGMQEELTTRAPGVVARLMGLESLPQPPRHRRSQSSSGVSEPPLQHGTPILLQDLLKRDYKTSKRSFRDRIPSIFPKRGPQLESPSNRFRKKSMSILTAFRCRPEVSCVSPAYIDIPATSRFLHAVARSPRSPFLSRLPPGSQLPTPTESPSLKPGSHGLLEEQIPQLSLRASSTGNTVVLQGWPLESQHIVPHDIFQEDYEPAVSTSFGSRPTDSASSKPLRGIGSYKVVEGRRRGSSWNGSTEGSESTIEQEFHRKPRAGRGGMKKAASTTEEKSLPSPHHQSSRTSEPASKTARRLASSKTSKSGKRDADLQPLMLQSVNSRTSISQESIMSASSVASISSKPPKAGAGKTKSSKAGRAERGDSSAVKVKAKEDDERDLRKRGSRSRSPSRSKEMAPGKPPPRLRSQKVVAYQENSGSRVFPANNPLKGAKIGEGDKTKKKGVEVTKTGSLSPGGHQHPSPLQRFSEKANGVAGGQTTKREVPRLSNESTKLQVQDLGDRLKKGNVHDEDMATQSSAASVCSVKGDDDTILRTKRRNKIQNKHASMRSVDDVFPELPLEKPNLDSKKKTTEADEESLSLNRPTPRVLIFGQGFSSSPDIDFYTGCKSGAGDQISTSPLIDFSSGACMLAGRLSVSLLDYDELPCLGDYVKEAGLSSSPLIDCDELHSLEDSGPPVSISAEEKSIPSEIVEVDDRRWENEIVETTLRGQCCERSCSGPSMSSESLPSDDERNGDSWSSCAYNNLGGCNSPKPFEIIEIDVVPEPLSQEHQNSPPAQFVKKILDPTGLDPSMDELAGQPSPVSILNAPFHDEACTTSESSLTDSIHQQLTSDEVVDEQELQPLSAATNVSNSDKIRQALLDISMFRSREESCTLEAQAMAPGHDTEDERTFIRGVLCAARFLSTPGSSPNWHDKDFAIDPSLFDKLESGDVVEFSFQAAGGLWRCDRKLLFDCVNEAFGVTRLWHCHSGPEGWLEEELVWRASRPRGEMLVGEVVKRIEDWRKLASYAIDSLIERDMSVHFGNWRYFGPEVAKVGLDIESTVWDAVLEEVVVDLIVSTSKRY